jgi:DNA (cytosine-5)-methyltransferase 1
MNVLEDGTVGTLRRETHGHEPVIIQPIALAENTIGRQPLNGGNGDGFTVGGPMYTLNATGVHGVAQPIPLDLRNAGRDPEKYDEINRQGVGVGEAGDPAHTLTSACVHGVAQPIAFSGQMSNPQVDFDITSILGAKNPMAVATNHPVLSFKAGQSETAGGIFLTKEFTPTLQAQNNGSTATPAVFTNMAVRRLTPTECERLQGFPDNYTNIPWRKKEESPDGPRYKALGNSMAVPVMHWIGKRIADAP